MDADAAYAEAVRRIERARAEGADQLDLGISGLNRLPSGIANCHSVTWLKINGSSISSLKPIGNMKWLWQLDAFDVISLQDISALSELPSLAVFACEGSGLRDVGPLSNQEALIELNLKSTNVLDLRPIKELQGLRDKPFLFGLTFKNTEATRLDPEIARIAEIDDNTERAAALFDYLEDWEPPVLSGVSLEAEIIEPIPSVSPIQRAQVEFLITSTPATRASSHHLRAQLSEALTSIPAAPGSNRLPEEFQVFEAIRDLLAAVETETEGDSVAEDRIATLEALIAGLEAKVAELSVQLGTALGENADLAAKIKELEGKDGSPSSWKLGGDEMVVGSIKTFHWFVRIGGVGGMIHLLGPQSPAIKMLLDVLGKF